MLTLYGTVFINDKNVYYSSLFFFAICNGLLGKTLKRLLAIQRPSESIKKHESLGMPSSHGNCFAFHSMYITLELYNNDKNDDDVVDVVVVSWYFFFIISYTLTFIICYTRVYYTYDHTVEQVLVGVVMGSVNAYLSRSMIYPSYSAIYHSLLHCVQHKYCL